MTGTRGHAIPMDSYRKTSAPTNAFSAGNVWRSVPRTLTSPKRSKAPMNGWGWRRKRISFDLSPPPLVEDPDRFYRSGEEPLAVQIPCVRQADACNHMLSLDRHAGHRSGIQCNALQNTPGFRVKPGMTARARSCYADHARQFLSEKLDGATRDKMELLAWPRFGRLHEALVSHERFTRPGYRLRCFPRSSQPWCRYTG